MAILHVITGGQDVASNFFNKRAQSNLFFLLMMGIVFILLVLAITPGAREVTTDAMNDSQLDCFNSSISDQNKAVCDSMDVQPFLYGAAIIGLAGILLKGAFG